MKDTNTIAGLRFQKYDSNQIHVHDDVRNLKFVATKAVFKKDLSEFLKQRDGGASIIEGSSKEKLLLVKDGKNISATILSDQDITKELKDFLFTL